MEKYNWIVNGDAQKQIEQYMTEEHTFDEYCTVSMSKHWNVLTSPEILSRAASLRAPISAAWGHVESFKEWSSQNAIEASNLRDLATQDFKVTPLLPSHGLIPTE